MLESRCSASEAASAAAKMFGCYRRGDANDPETYALAVAAVLSCYPADVVREVCDPRTGIPGKLKWLPVVAEVKEACEAAMEPHRKRVVAHRQEQKQLAARHEAPLSPEERAEMLAKLEAEGLLRPKPMSAAANDKKAAERQLDEWAERPVFADGIEVDPRFAAVLERMAP